MPEELLSRLSGLWTREAPLPARGYAIRSREALGPRARMRRENDFALRHCERQRSNPGRLARNLDCFVAAAPRNDEKRRKGCDEK
jgi:hypothetical protein